MDWIKFEPSEIHPEAFIADGAKVIGRVILKKGASLWFNAVVRADLAEIIIGEESNVQDNVVIHVEKDKPTIIGDRVTIGHGAILHACHIGNDSLIGMGSIILDGASIGSNCLVAAGSVVPPQKSFPDGWLIMGIPAKAVRELTPEEKEIITSSARRYHLYAESYRQLQKDKR
ncbi:MAG: gamma carbonic anhydrase family protein [Candidatus Aminicenantes bacterium]|nr:gamma carbonic anhydrase family protein [Candidatus Aminicenantes bacterium]